MKKFLAIAMIAASLTACGGGDKTEETPAADSTVAPATETPAAPAADSTVAPAADSTAPKADSAAKK